MAEPFRLGAQKGTFLDEIRYAGSNIAEGTLESIPALFDAIDKTARKVAAGTTAGVRTANTLFDSIDGNAEQSFLSQFRQEMDKLAVVEQQNKTLGTIIAENIGKPLADVTNKFFDAAQGDVSKIKNADLKAGIYQFVGDFVAPVGIAAKAKKAAEVGSLLSQIGTGAEIGAKLSGVLAIGQSENLGDYLKNVALGTGMGGAAPVVAAGLGKGFKAAKSAVKQTYEFGKNTSARILQGEQWLKQDRNTRSMNTIKQAQDRIIAQQAAARKPVAAPKINPEAQAEMQENFPKEVLDAVPPEQQAAFKQQVIERAKQHRKTLRRREIAKQRLRELKAQKDYQTVELKKQAVEQQLEKVKQFLKQYPQKLNATDKQKAIQNNVEKAKQLQARLEANQVQDNQQLAPGRQALQKYIDKNNANLQRAQSIQRAKVEQAGRKELGIDDPKLKLEDEVARLDQELENLTLEKLSLKDRLASEAESYAQKAETVENYYKEQGLPRAGYEDGKMFLSVSENTSDGNPLLVKKNGEKFTVSRDKDGKVTSVEREATPVEKAVEEADKDIYNQLDRMFGLSETPPVVTKESVKEKPAQDKVLGFTTNKFKDQIRKLFMPIQNAVDELSQNIGNALAKLEAGVINKPIALMQELAQAVGYDSKSFDPNGFYKYIKSIFPDNLAGKDAYAHAAEKPENLTPEQRDFLIRSQAFWASKKDYLESTGIESGKLVDGLYAPREYKYNDWYKLQDEKTKFEVERRIEQAKDGTGDNDLVMNELTESRKIEILDERYLGAHHNPADAMIIRLKKIAKQEALQEFFGNKLKKGQGHRALIQEMIKKEGLSDTPDGRQLEVLLNRLFDKTPYSDNPVMNLFNKLRYAVTLGSVETAAKQPLLGANRNAWRFGIMRFLKGLQTVNDPMMQNHLAGILGDIEKGEISSTLKLFDTVSTGLFQQSNKAESAITMSTTYQWLVDHAHAALNGKGNRSFLDYMNRRFGEDSQRLIEKFAGQKNKKYSGFDEDVMNTLVTAARDKGSLALSKADKTYAALGNDITSQMYKLGTYSIKETNTLVDNTIGEMKRGTWGTGMKNLVTQVALSTAFSGVIVDQIMRTGSAIQTGLSEADHGFIEGAIKGYQRGGIDRLAGKVSDAYLSLVPFLNKYTVDNIFDSNNIIEMIANKVVPGLGTAVKVPVDFTKATIDKYVSEAKGGDINLTGGFDPDFNPSYKNLPPRIATGTYYNVIDPLVRGQNAEVVRDEFKKVQFEQTKTAKAQTDKQIKQVQDQVQKGVPERYLNTPKGQMLAANAGNKKYQEYIQASKAFSEIDKARGVDVYREAYRKFPDPRDRQAYVDSLPLKDRRAYWAHSDSVLDNQYRELRITPEQWVIAREQIAKKAFPGKLKEAQEFLKEVVGSGK